jgi:hypothetical protein
MIKLSQTWYSRDRNLTKCPAVLKLVRDQEWGLARPTTVEIRVLTLRTTLGYTIDPRALARYREFRDEGLDMYGIVDDEQRFKL